VRSILHADNNTENGCPVTKFCKKRKKNLREAKYQKKKKILCEGTLLRKPMLHENNKESSANIFNASTVN
jgi:hypothetical protein